ncbi:MAG: ABC transporter permease [Oligoflexia bacterium]|nr:ABC transporter permease [Oligoflexia bacterium]
MITLWKLAYRNAIRHKMSSIVFILVFCISALVIYWCFGFCNYILDNLNVMVRNSYGDVAFTFDFANKSKFADLKNRFPELINKVVLEREIKVMVDGQDKSIITTIIEMTDDNRERLAPHVRPQSGRLPLQQNSDEMAITNFNKADYSLNDEVYLTTTTSAKIINTIKYKIVGIIRGTAIKAMGFGYVINQKDMDVLVNSRDDYNLLYIFLNSPVNSSMNYSMNSYINPRSDDEMMKIQNEIKGYLKEQGINVKLSWNINQTVKNLQIFLEVFKRIKVLLLIFIFPLLGAVIAAIVWMYSFKRRKEIWTYHSLGLKRLQIIMSMGGEYLLIAFIGTILGLLLGEFSAVLADKNNAWLTFSYTVTTAVRFKFGFWDWIISLSFMELMVLIWIEKPITRILKARPFSF